MAAIPNVQLKGVRGVRSQVMLIFVESLRYIVLRAIEVGNHYHISRFINERWIGSYNTRPPPR
jgi:hypothetical protein